MEPPHPHPLSPTGILNGSSSEQQIFEVAFCTVPMLGHLMPLLPIASQVLRRGHSVTFFHEADPKYRQKIESCGLQSSVSIVYESETKSPFASESLYECICSHYQKREKPNVVVYDFFAHAAADAADKLGVSAVIGVYPNPLSLNPWAATLEDQQKYRWTVWCYFLSTILEGVLARALLCRRNWMRWKLLLPWLAEQDLYPSPYMPRIIIGCAPPELEFSNLQDASPLFHMVGPSLPDNYGSIHSGLQRWMEDQEAANRPIVYMAFGSMANHTLKSVRKIEADLLDLGDDIALIWSLPAQDQSALLAPIPSHWRVDAFFPQISLLQSGRIRCFVTHCGSNSVAEALLSGVPMVCCPGFADQPANATRLARAAVGVIVKNHEVGAALQTMIKNIDEMTERSRVLAQKLMMNNSAEKAATLIEGVARGEVISDNPNSSGRYPWSRALLMLGGAAAVALFSRRLLKDRMSA